MQNMEAKIQAYENAKTQYETKIKELETKLAVLENEKKQLDAQMLELFGTQDTKQAEQMLSNMVAEIEKLEQEFKKEGN